MVDILVAGCVGFLVGTLFGFFVVGFAVLGSDHKANDKQEGADE